MKATKFFAMLFAFAALSFTVTSCGDDDDDIDPNELITGQTKAEFTKKTANELELTLKSAIYTTVYNAKFDKNKKLTSYICTTDWATEEMAATYYKEVADIKDYKVTKSGKKVTVDFTAVLEGADYDTILASFEEMLKGGSYNL